MDKLYKLNLENDSIERVSHIKYDIIQYPSLTEMLNYWKAVIAHDDIYFYDTNEYHKSAEELFKTIHNSNPYKRMKRKEKIERLKK